MPRIFFVVLFIPVIPTQELRVLNTKMLPVAHVHSLTAGMVVETPPTVAVIVKGGGDCKVLGTGYAKNAAELKSVFALVVIFVISVGLNVMFQ